MQTMAHEDEEIERVYEQLDDFYKKQKKPNTQSSWETGMRKWEKERKKTV